MYQINLTRKTYYGMGILAVAMTMAGAIGVLVGTQLLVFDNIGFVLTDLMFLLLAALPDGTSTDKKRYFLCFLLALLSVVQITAAVNYILTGLYWPVFALYAYNKDETLWPQTRLLLLAEGVTIVFRLLAGVAGMSGFVFPANLFFLLVTIARGWLIYSLYRREKSKPDSQNKA